MFRRTFLKVLASAAAGPAWLSERLLAARERLTPFPVVERIKIRQRWLLSVEGRAGSPALLEVPAGSRLCELICSGDPELYAEEAICFGVFEGESCVYGPFGLHQRACFRWVPGLGEEPTFTAIAPMMVKPAGRHRITAVFTVLPGCEPPGGSEGLYE
jgi:hypothetical protein